MKKACKNIDQWFYPANSPLAGEPLSPQARKVIEGVLECYSNLTPEKAIEITWAFGGI
jgi:hypothetical protein